MFRRICAVMVCLMVAAAVAGAQDGRLDAAISGFGFFTKDASGNKVSQTSTNSGGPLLSLRYFMGTHSGLEFNYGHTRNSQFYSTTVPSLADQQTNIHEFSADYVYKLGKIWKVNPFVMGGGGVLLFSPVSSSTILGVPGASRQAEGTFLYGAGLDYHLLGRLGLRLQYRGFLYRAPDFFNTTFSTGKWTQSAEPAVGLTFRF
jgi:opacity protein-like surface antigen